MNNQLPCHRRSIRLPGNDYAQPGAYFVTVVAYGRKTIFGTINDESVLLNQAGKIVERAWLRLPTFFPVTLDAWVIMPNHVHGIIQILDTEIVLPIRNIQLGRGEASAKRFPIYPGLSQADASPSHPIGTQPGCLGAIIQNFKSITTRQINRLRYTPGAPVWQRNYYEHVIRKEVEWDQIRKYIEANPLNWQQDDLYNQLGRSKCRL